jgi:hypothetical protein
VNVLGWMAWRINPRWAVRLSAAMRQRAWKDAVHGDS